VRAALLQPTRWDSPRRRARSDAPYLAIGHLSAAGVILRYDDPISPLIVFDTRIFLLLMSRTVAPELNFEQAFPKNCH
jgi:hypothetical protein